MSDLWKLTAVEIADLVASKKVTATEVTQSALGRLEAVNSRINAVVQHMPDEALATARRIDAAIARDETVGPMAGVPVTTKVNVDQSGFATTNGLRLQENLIAEQDNPVVANLKNADAVIIGRTNTPAFSLRWFCRNSLHGHTLNPHNNAITPGGSSGGCASATASGIGAIGHGTDIAGSIRYPAYACGIHGIRPSFGRVPAVNFTAPDRHLGGQIMAVSGPLARSLEDLKLGYQVMSSQSHLDPWWTPAPLYQPTNNKNVALDLTPSGLNTEPAVKEALQQAAQKLEDAGFNVEEVKSPNLREAASLQAILWLAEFLQGTADMVAKENDEDAVFVYEQMLRHCGEVSLERMMKAIQRRVGLVREWNIFFEKYPVLLCPVSAKPPFEDLVDVKSPADFDDVFEAQLLQIATPFCGLPGLVVSTSISEDNIPMGVQLVSARFNEAALFNAGAAIAGEHGIMPPIDPV